MVPGYIFAHLSLNFFRHLQEVEEIGRFCWKVEGRAISLRGSRLMIWEGGGWSKGNWKYLDFARC